MIPDQALRDAVYGAQNINPTSDTAAGSQPEVDQAFKTRFQAPVIHAGANALVNQSQMNADEAKKAAEAAKQAAAAASDPKNFQKIPKSDGGFGFYDPTGKEISAHDYAIATGTPLDKVVANSENPIDIGFREDYSNLQQYLTAWQNGDQKKIDAIQKANPALAKIKDPHELIGRFMQAYPTIFAAGGFNGAGTAGQPVGSDFIPNADAQESNATYGGGGSGLQL